MMDSHVQSLLPGPVMDPPSSISKVYTHVNEERGLDYWNYESVSLRYGAQENYEIIARVGRGKYSEVFLGVDIRSLQRVIIKVLKPVRSRKIKREIKLLKTLSGGPNMIKLLDIVRDPESKVTSLIFEHINNLDFKTGYLKFSDMDVRYYMYELLKALDFCHSMGVMHRDVKPQNVMIDHEQRQLRLIDLGLAEFYHPGVQYGVHVASRFFKGPELLVKMQCFDYSLDLWSFGCMMAGIVFQKEPFFRGSNDIDQLVKIVSVLGIDDFNDYIEKYSLKLDFEITKALEKIATSPKKSFSKFTTPKNAHLVSKEALDLLDNLLQYDHQLRFTAQEAMAHPYFDPVRSQSTL